MRDLQGINCLTYITNLQLFNILTDEDKYVIHHPIITPFWVLTGKDKCVQET